MGKLKQGEEELNYLNFTLINKCLIVKVKEIKSYWIYIYFFYLSFPVCLVEGKEGFRDLKILINLLN